mgnify:CR=1 FL=1
MEALNQILEEVDGFLGECSQTSEIELIRHLQSRKVEPFCEFNLSHSQDLFRAHFLLKHALFRLQDLYLNQEAFLLDISLVRIRRDPYYQEQASLTAYSSVKAYYLDISHYFETQEEEVNELLNKFWQKFLAQDERSAALKTLGLPDDAGHEQVKKQYRRLAQVHHPDKGGCETQFKKISAAKNLLDKVYS